VIAVANHIGFCARFEQCLSNLFATKESGTAERSFFARTFVVGLSAGVE
jgi:hypothetical protein